MSTVGVTIGIGEKFQHYAKCAAAAAQRHLELDRVVILGEEHTHHIPKHIKPFQYPAERACYLKFLIPQLVQADRYVYFDADLFFVRKPDSLAPIHDGLSSYVVRDRIFREDVRNCETRLGIPHRTYFNAGLLIFGKQDAGIFAKMAKEYDHVPKAYWDQCVFNKMWGGRFLPRWWNDINWYGHARNFAPVAIHCASNYQHYEQGGFVAPQENMEDYNHALPDGFDPDGFTQEGNLWLYSGGRFVVYSQYGTFIKEMK